MAYQLSDESLGKLQSVHQDLQRLVYAVCEFVPLEVMVGYRDKDAQSLAVSQGRSKTPFPSSKHNQLPSLAVDITPLPYFPENTVRLYYFSGFVLGVAKKLGIALRCGADWNQNFDPSDEHFVDLFHFELNRPHLIPMPT